MSAERWAKIGAWVYERERRAVQREYPGTVVWWRTNSGLLLRDRSAVAAAQLTANSMGALVGVRAVDCREGARLTELVDERGCADTPAARERATFEWMLEATREIDRLRDEIKSLSRTLASRTEHLV